MTYQYIISKAIDPFFAIGIGVAATLARIHREEKEKGRSPAQSLEVLRRRWRFAVSGERGGS
ncbi:hypothetical protein K490DRAFT_48444 [Saccharata proteae CBS 121410]|uniref:Non-classical export protein 1 n=1 Tax=Saccharata proteae CBS 121410 TaxID=1314787 RepID=A0A9P4HSY1_9PEZI|nr:hypothetical protein K490DRAFT_48444 [Saccharata proteae CBS 121410]